ncbi:uncharacterized protein BYT42DRAFT_589912 [Radiomyces spectabilis]|uniref:uncharacterized protein n=1 Tax=Radiomyces spectabilis TaxID=64574 RepID=UPI00221F7FEC|nr:uncharacterized protein BYT42DRAFT_589912 [Radiomyces spectabilis]KAI8364640.1 hypothetical protein BYT42DRAFT_589912 [Radiomyces spectabilis]
MSKKGRNPPDADERDPPPSYTESENISAYNPNFVSSSSYPQNTPSHPPSSPQQQYLPPPSAPLSPHAQPLLYPEIPQSPSPQPFQPQPYNTPSHQYQSSPNVRYSSVPPQPYPPQNYQTIPMPSTPYGRHEARPLLVRRPSENERRFPLAALFFLFGWFLPILWIFGACCCAGSRNRYEAWWGKLNFIMVMMLIVSTIVYSMIAVAVDDWSFGMQYWTSTFSVE